jgi:uncharacterized beta-barrel protein YwiB (DUF1934 family)
MKVRVQLTGGEGVIRGITYPGELEMDKENFSLSWNQPPEKRGDPEVCFFLLYCGAERPMTLKRTGDADMRLEFLEGSKTKGLLKTGHGDMYLETDTKALKIALQKDLSGEAAMPRITLCYDLYFEGQPPVRNELEIQATLEKR